MIQFIGNLTQLNHQSNEKLYWIDVVRGEAILLVVIGHSGCPSLIYNFIYSFHMPLFFVISGYLYNYEKWNKGFGYKIFVLNRFASYVKPYFILCGINFILCLLQEIIKNGISTNTVPMIGKWMFGILYVYPSVEYMPNCTPLWFLVALFFSSIIFYYILEVKNRKIQFLIIIGIAVVDAGLFYLVKFQMPWCFGAVLIGVCCMYFGFFIRRSSKIIDFCKKPPVILSLIIIGIIFGYINGRVGVGANNLGYNPFLFWMSALTLPFAIILYFSAANQKFELLNWFGKNTILFIGFNYFFNSLPELVWRHILPFAKYSYPWYIRSIVCIVCISCTILVWNKAKEKWPLLHKIVGF